MIELHVTHPAVRTSALEDDLTTFGGAGLALPGLLIGGTLHTHTYTHTHTVNKYHVLTRVHP